MPKTIEELQARQTEIRSRLAEIDEEFKGKELTEETRTEWDNLEEEHSGNLSLLEELEFRSERVAALSGKEENREKGADFHTRRSGATRNEDIWNLTDVRSAIGNPQEAAGELRDRAMRAIEQSRFPHPSADREASQAHLEKLVGELDGDTGTFSRHLLVTGSPTYRSAFVKAISKRNLSPEESRALSLAPGEKGGFLLPYALDPTIIPVSNGTRNPIRAISRVEQTTTNEWKGVTSDGMTAAYREAEGEETTDDSPKLAQPTVEAHAADAFAQWTYEFGQDYGAIGAELAKLVQQAKDDLEAVKFWSGSGEKEPQGVNTGATEVVETAEEGKFGEPDLFTLEETLADTRFGVNARFVGKRAIYNKVRQFGNVELWVKMADGFARRPDGALGQGLLGYPTYELSTMDSKVEKGKILLVFGDFDYYIIVDRIGMMAKPIDNIPGPNGRPTGQEGLYFFWRNGAKAISKKAFRKLKVK
ncbi:MAG TPA: phage major capsid protein [Solirubrobacterales bacterium]|nr:phage major capsid protein [Solirubrobacterales bacterium]